MLRVLPGCGLDLEGTGGLDAGPSDDASVTADDALGGLDGASDASGRVDVGGATDASAKDATASDTGAIVDAGPPDAPPRDSGTVGDPGIRCAGSYCNPATEVCCKANGSYACTASGSCTGIAIPCDDRVECATGSVCCARLDGQGRLTSVSCASSPPGCNGNATELCDPDASACPVGTTCQPTSPELQGFFECN